MDPDVILNDTQETEEKTEEERKRDHRNALRRAAYWRNKDKRIKDQNKRPSGTSGIRLRSISFSEAGPYYSRWHSSSADKSNCSNYVLKILLIQTT